MSNKVGETFVEVRADTRNFDRELQSGVERSGGQAGSRLKGVLGKALAGFAAVAAGAAVGSFFKDAISGASDLQETTTKIAAIFGDASKQVQTFASGGAAALGQSKQAVLDAAATFGVFGKAAGLSGGDLAKFSTGFATLSTDLASFNNTTPEQAVEAIGAALRGEAEPLRSYGVLLDDATLRQEALSLGLIKTTKDALTPQQKVLAAQSTIYKQTSDAQGDFERTSGGLANQQRILSAQFTDVKAKVGEALLPAITGLVTALNTGVGPAFTRVREVVGPVAAQLAANLQPAFERVKTAVLALVPGFLAFGARLVPVVKQLGAQLAPVLRQIGQVISTQVVPAIKAVLPVLAPVAAFFLKVFGGAVIGALKGVVNVVSGVLTTITGVVRAFSALLRGDWSALWAAVKQIVSGVFTAIKGAVQVFLNLGIIRAFSLGFAALKGLVTAGFSAVRGIFTGGFSAVEGLTRTVLTRITGLFTGGFNAVKGVVTGAFGAIRGAVQSGMSAAQGVIGTALGAVRGLFTAAFNAYVTVVRTVLGAIVGAVRSAMSAVIGGIRAPLSSVGSIFAGAFRAAVGAVRGGIGAVLGLVRGLAGSIRAATSGFGSLLRSAGSNLIKGLANGITGAVGQVVDAAKRAAKAAVSAVKGALGINSPSKVFTEIGSQTGAGLALGLDKSRRPVAAAAKDLLDVAGMRVGGAGYINSRLAATGAAAGAGEQHTHYHLTAQASEVSIDEQRALELLRRMEDLHA